jgi:hypothetical protein
MPTLADQASGSSRPGFLHLISTAAARRLHSIELG